MGRTVPTPVAPPGTLPVRVQFGQVGSVNQAAYSRQPPKPIILQPGAPLRREQTGSRQLNAIQENTRQMTGQARADPKANGRLLENVSLSSSAPNTISHGLGIPFRGCDLSGFSVATTWSIVRAGTNPQLDQTSIVISVASSTVVDIWVYG